MKPSFLPVCLAVTLLFISTPAAAVVSEVLTTEAAALAPDPSDDPGSERASSTEAPSLGGPATAATDGDGEPLGTISARASSSEGAESSVPTSAAVSAPPSQISQPLQEDAPIARYDAFARLGARWVTDPRFDLVSENDVMPRLDLGIGYVPGWMNGTLTLELAYSLSGTQAPLFEELTAGLMLHSIGGAGSFTLLDHGIGRAFGRAGASLIFANLELRDENLSFDEPALVQTTLLLGLEGVVGYELQLPINVQRQPQGARINLSVEVGYELTPFAADFDVFHRSGIGKSTPPRIASRAIDVGQVDLSGWQLRFGGGIRF